jgi:thioester reductase-like protein
MERIAVIGMACRFPGAPNPAEYWQMLLEGREGVREPPCGRPELEPPPWLLEQSPFCRRGGFLENLDLFEPGFFRISPREAARMDPQQRILLEVAWEALEDGGQSSALLAGTNSGVFVGVMNADFARRHAQNPSQIDAQLGPGCSLAIASNRISFCLDLRGPSMSVDTLCSSSLVAIHLACQSLLTDESSPLAIAGGANVILDRTMDVFYARAGLLSTDGRCRAFDASARGIVRGEGVGLVVLKRLSRALADGDRIHAVILGSAVNQDGRSNGLTSPNRFSQEEVLRTAYQRAGVIPNRVRYVETHGTGTLIGDPIETAALGAVLSEGRAPAEPCAIGSVKTNLGHLESAAGVASFIKAVLSLENRYLVPSLHFATPNPYLHLEERGLRVQTQPEAWPDGATVTGVSSFGMGGTNAHIVLEAVAAQGTTRQLSRRASLIPISARSVAALEVLQRRSTELLSSGKVALEDLAHSTGSRRDHHDHRSAVVARSPTDIAFSACGSAVPGRSYKLVFVVPAGVACDPMCGSELSTAEPVFREAMERSISRGETRLTALQVALAGLWRSFGFEPDAVVHASSAAEPALADSLGDDGTVFIEIAPQPHLICELRGILERAGVPGAALSSFVPELGERVSMLRAIGQLYCLGVNVNWKRLDALGARFVPLGSYPWQRELCALSPAQPSAPEQPREILVPRWVRAGAPLPRLNGAGDWLILGDGGATANALVAELHRAGHRARVADWVAHAEAVLGIIQFCSDDLGATVRLVQALARRVEPVRLWLVTRGAHAIEDDTNLASLAASTVWGLGRVVVNEHPRLRCKLVDLSATERLTDAAMLRAELLSDDDELEIAIRATDRYAARLHRQLLALSPARPRMRGEAAYLITGGFGGLGLAAAQRLVELGARTLVLVGRRGAATDQARMLVAELAARGATVIVERADVSDRAALEAVMRRHVIHGVIHAAGTMSPAMITAIDPDTLGASMRAKIDGARHLHELTASHPLDFFVLYSSVATLLGMPGQGAYAASNAYLDALAEHRRAIGLPAVSIAWTVIEDTGMAANAGAQALSQLTDRGIATLSVRTATELLEQLLGGEAPPHLGAVTFDHTRWAAYYPHAKSIPRLKPLADSNLLRADAGLAAELRSREGADRVRALETYLATMLVTVLHLAHRPEPHQSLVDLGIDSLTALELQTLLEADLGMEAPTDGLLLGPSIRELATQISAQLGGEAAVMATKALISLRAEAKIDPAMTFTQRKSSSVSEILLTGATGFLGAFVLAELLEETDAAIRCLVRAESASTGMRRLEEVLGRNGIHALNLRARVTCIAGDLAKPRLGLEARDFDRTAHSVDTIIHSGAFVNFALPYEALEATNVGGTREVLRLAALGGARLHYVSTIGVFPGGPAHRDVVLEDARPTEPEQLALGYTRTKWVAEQLMVQGSERGADVSIYRPGTISGHSTSGVFNPDDFVCALIKGCIQLGIAPHVETAIHFAPVDYVSRALVRIALRAPQSSGTYHLVGPRAVAWTDVAGWIRRLGYPLEELSYGQWRSILIERATATRNALAPFLSLFVSHENTDWLHLPPYDDARSKRALVEAGVVCPTVDAGLVRRYVERFVVNGYLQRPG